MAIPTMITDLAALLMTAAVVTILFRRLRLPLILGYILAGFITGPYFPYFYDVSNRSSIGTWSEIGVILILFHIGMSFSVTKLANLGSTAVVTAVVKMSGVMAVGYGFGMLIGLGNMNSIFLGAMLSISSTVVIKKSFEELGVQGAPYAGPVMGSLIVEDILGIFLMVLLSTMSVSQSSSGTDLSVKLLLMVAYLVIWLLLGVYLLPTFLNRVADVMSEEMLTILSMGLCFFMAYLASKLGFSMDLGAFLAGSLLAGTVHVEKIERATRGIKDMFGAIFFLSVGMMVDPQVILKSWTIILPLVLVVILAKLVFATAGMVLSGQRLGTAVRGGISLAPIGEFSFIIASLGVSLKVMEESLYPLIVAAAVLTMILTPTLIRNADHAVALVKKLIPLRLQQMIDAYTADQPENSDLSSDWPKVLGAFFRKVALFGTMMLVFAVFAIRIAEPSLTEMMPETLAKVLTLVVTYLMIAVFFRPLMDFHSINVTNLWLESRANRPGLLILIMLKFVLVVLIAFLPLHDFFGAGGSWFLVGVVAAIIFVSRSDLVSTSYLQMETRFLRNLNERLIDKEERLHGKQHWLDEDYSISSFFLPEDAVCIGKSLKELNWGRNQNIYILKMRRGEKSILLPPAKTVLRAGDKLYAVAEASILETFIQILNVEPDHGVRTLKEFMETDYADTATAMSVLAVKVQGSEPYCNRSIKLSGIQEKAHCMILGIQKDGFRVTMPDANLMIQKDDILWLMGSNKHLAKMAALSAEE